jgi:hypothetical protein
MYKAPPQNPARMFHGYMFSDINVYMAMKQAVPAHCMASLIFIVQLRNVSLNLLANSENVIAVPVVYTISKLSFTM